MGIPLRVLIVEDSPDDATLIIRHLIKGGYEPDSTIVQNADEMRRALAGKEWDLILCDYSMPAFDTFAALTVARDSALDLPFVVVSGSIDQETAVAAMRAGASDYLLKDNLTRLVPAIRREIQEAHSRRSRRIAEQELAAVKEELAVQLSDMTSLHQLSVRLSSATDLQQVSNEIAAGIKALLSTDVAVLKLCGPGGERAIQPPGLGISLHARSGELLGQIEVLRGNAGELSARERRLIELYTRQAGEVLHNVQLYEKAQEANRLKDEFVAMVSHELRTPLTPIVGAVHMIRSGKEPATTARALEMIDRNVKIQAQIIEDLLDVSRIASGKLRLRLSYVDVRKVIESAVATVRSSADSKQIHLEVVCTPIDGVVLGDADRLQQVLWNLLSNAVKFTSPGGRVTVSMESDKHSVEIRITDTGIGIPSDFLPHVFDRFRQADGSTTRRHGGLGLGLSIVKQLVELHGGAVQAMSEGSGKGASFLVRFPMKAEEPARSA